MTFFLKNRFILFKTMPKTMPKTSYEHFIYKKWVERKDVFETKNRLNHKRGCNLEKHESN